MKPPLKNWISLNAKEKETEEKFRPARRQPRCCANCQLLLSSTFWSIITISSIFFNHSLEVSLWIIWNKGDIIIEAIILTCCGKQRHPGQLGQSGVICQTWATSIVIAILSLATVRPMPQCHISNLTQGNFGNQQSGSAISNQNLIQQSAIWFSMPSPQ